MSVGVNDPRLGIDAGDLRHHDPQIGLTAQNRADRPGDIGRRQGRGRDLIQQRLEAMMVLPVDQHDVHRRPGQSARRFQPAEAAADNHHARPDRLFRHRKTPVISGLIRALTQALHSLTQLSADSIAKAAVRLEFRHPRP